MGPTKSDHTKLLIKLTVITLSGTEELVETVLFEENVHLTTLIGVETISI